MRILGVIAVVGWRPAVLFVLGVIGARLEARVVPVGRATSAVEAGAGVVAGGGGVGDTGHGAGAQPRVDRRRPVDARRGAVPPDPVAADAGDEVDGLPVGAEVLDLPDRLGRRSHLIRKEKEVGR